MKTVWIPLFLLVVALMAACSDDGVRYTPTDNTVKPDTMQCEVKDDSTIYFFTTAVNSEVYPKPDTSRIIVSGTMAVNPFCIYSIYFTFRFKDKAAGEYDLAGSDGLTRFERIIGSTTIKEEFAFDVAGKVNIKEFNDNKIRGTFSFTAKTADKKKSITIENGTFIYKSQY